MQKYDRVARLYRPMEPLFLIHAGARRRAVGALRLRPGDTVLEIGCGTGRNFPYLAAAVGPAGTIIGVDASTGMLRQAERLLQKEALANVELLQQDVEKLDVPRSVDAVLFSLSYSVIPKPRPALARAWERLRPGGRVVVMDAGIPDSGIGRALDPIARLLVKLAPGDPYSRPWVDLAELGDVATERFLLGIYYVCTVTKPAAAAGNA